MSVLSLYIPIISDSISENYIKKIFVNKNIGKILRVDFVKNLKKNRREAFIHFDEWFINDEVNALKKDIEDPNTKAKLMYNDKNFWPLLVNKNPHKRVNNPNYSVLQKSEVTNVYKTNLNLLIKNSKSKSKSNNKEETKNKKPKTYAEVAYVQFG